MVLWSLWFFPPDSGGIGFVLYLSDWWDREPFVRFVVSFSSSGFVVRSVYRPMSSVGMVLTVEVGLADGSDSISVFIIHPSWNTEHGSSSTGY